ncbi:MAG: signal peptidase I [Thermoplasmata archaeon]|nr:MAG: signal peptidase I [Thermoplasmata archaeon]
MKKEKIFNIILIVVVSLFVLSFIIIPFADKSSRWYIVTSGSMEPTLKVGDVVFVSDADADEIKVGDIINFYNGEREYTITHRCVEIIKKGNETFFKTKGDANEENDTFLTSQDALIGKIPYAKIFGHVVYAKVPRLGYISSFVHTKIGFFLFILLPAGTLMGMETYNIFMNLQEKTDGKEKRTSQQPKKRKFTLSRGNDTLEMITCPQCRGIFYSERMNEIDEMKCVYCGKKWRIKC